MLSRGSYLPRSTLASQRIRDWADPPEAGNDAKRRCERAGYQDLEDIEPITVCDLHRDLAAPSRAPTLVFANPAAPVNGLDVLSAKGRLIGKIRRSQAKRILSSRGVATKRPPKNRVPQRPLREVPLSSAGPVLHVGFTFRYGLSEENQ
jgi:hypothetical protein